MLLYYFCHYFPVRATSFLRGKAQKALPPNTAMDPNFAPLYNPWDQRICLCPDGDYFKCFKSKRAQVVTDTIKTVAEAGIELDNGENLDADVIIIANGLQMQFFGGVKPTINGKPVDVSKEYLWRYSMISLLPNFGNIIDYWNLSWTLGADVSIKMYICLIKHMRANEYILVHPQISAQDKKLKDVPTSPLHSTYVKNSTTIMPKLKSARHKGVIN
jgi:cation diffusion facilitator CzcD-associated flavoprotein CzcO